MLTRRQLIRVGAVTAAGVLLSPAHFADPRGAAAGPGAYRLYAPLVQRARATLNPASLPKFVTPMVIPPAMPRTSTFPAEDGQSGDFYEIAVRQFTQQILPAGWPTTTVWSYGSATHAGTFNYPAFTIEARWNAPVRVKWINDLKDPVTGHYLPHLLAVDPTLHWANPPGGLEYRDTRPEFSETPGPYTGPVPIVTHVHGAHTSDESDGYAEAWFLPVATNIPGAYARTGSYYDQFKAKSEAQWGVPWTPGSAVAHYPNNQGASTLWYHDHTLGMTRLNVYAGPAGFYLLRGGSGDQVTGVLPGPAPALDDAPGTRYYEIPLAIQDRSFGHDGSLFFPDSRAFFDGIEGPYIPHSDISPIWNPEFFGNTMVVNGKTWPYLEVEPRRYRLRFLNGCNARFLILRMSNGQSFWQIGAEGGFLPAPVELQTLLMSPAERADVIVDFTGLVAGTEITLLNLGPDEPFGGGIPNQDFPAADPATTGQVMQFRVVAATGADPSTPPQQLGLPPIVPLGAASVTRQLSLNEEMSTTADGPAAALLGTMHDGEPVHMEWHDPVSENPALGATEIWQLYNTTEDAHPIHVHEVMFEVVNRQGFEEGDEVRPPEPWETGVKDTVIAYPSEITRIKARFDLPGLYVWHCHIVDHEDNEMMRPYRVGP